MGLAGYGSRMPAAPATGSADLPAELAAANTLWEAACVLLDRWRKSMPASPARHSFGDPWTAWAEIVDQTQRHFAGERAADEIDDADRSFLLSVTSNGTVPDAVDAAAWGLSNATSHTFAPAWRDALGGGRHRLAHGEFFPVADVPWFPGEKRSPRPASMSPPPVDELPHVRVHDSAQFDVTTDFRFWRALEAVAVGLDYVAAAHPNERCDELLFPQMGKQIFPVTPADPSTQQSVLLHLARMALDSKAAVTVFPELCLTDADVQPLHDLLLDWGSPHLMVVGSYHTVIAEEHENLAVGILAGQDEFLEQTKATPFSDELSLGSPSKEGIRLRARPHLYVHQADRFRVALAICKDVLDARVGRFLDRMAVNLLLVPALSAKTDPFRLAVEGRVMGAQALAVVVNGPLQGPDGNYTGAGDHHRTTDRGQHMRGAIR